MSTILLDALYGYLSCTTSYVQWIVPAIPFVLLLWKIQQRIVGFHVLHWTTIHSKTLLETCKKAGIKGYKTNHSLLATAATRLYLSGVDEQLVMELTGHRSIEGIRSYKRTSREQQENVSDFLNGKKPCMDVATTDSTHLRPLAPQVTNSFQNPPFVFPFSDTSVPLPPSASMTGTSHSQSLTTNICAPQSSTANTDHTGAFYLHSYSNITINFNNNPKPLTSTKHLRVQLFSILLLL